MLQNKKSNPGAERRWPIGPHVLEDGASFRVWAPARSRVCVVVEGAGEHPLPAEPGGYFSGFVRGIGPGARYRFRLDDGASLYPDPASPAQPEGPHGPSLVLDPGAHRWRDQTWQGLHLEGQVIYEMHVGTFTPEGTWLAAATRLPILRDLGATLIEMMPVNEFPGRFGWGYDGVGLFAPTRIYGTPDDLKSFIDAAHGLGLGVILDVVYNHFGPDGNFFAEFAPDYFLAHENEWGASINFDGKNSSGVREFVTANAAYWIAEFHFDGLRLDATHAIRDSSPAHILAEIGAAARRAGSPRSVLVIAENEPTHTRIVRPPESGGYGLDALWNDDFHHSARVTLTGRREAYYRDYAGSPQELISAAKYGALFQGQRFGWQKRPRGTPGLDIAPFRFVNFLQNHDQVGNTARGLRLHQLADPSSVRAMTALLLLLPQTPLLFQGQEFWASAPFLFFADFNAELNAAVREGRRKSLAQFPSTADNAMQKRLPDPGDPQTFARCKLDWFELERNEPVFALHRDLLRLRREDPVFAAEAGFCGKAARVDGAVIGPQALLLRFVGSRGADARLVIANFGLELRLESIPDPLAAPPGQAEWELLWSSEHPDYGGGGTAPVVTEDGWSIPGHAAVVLSARFPVRSGTKADGSD